MENEINYAKVSRELLEFRELESEVHPLCEKLWQYDYEMSMGGLNEQDKIDRLELMDKIAHIVGNAWLQPLPYRDRD